MDRVINTPPPGFVKLPRSILAEEWARKPAQLVVFVRLLLSANREPKTWNGIRVLRGQFVTSYRSLSESCGLKVNAVRQALNVLQKAGAARLSAHSSTRSKEKNSARFAARGYTLVTICNYDSYEGMDEEGRTLIRTLQNKDSARLSARKPATTKEDIRNNIYISPVEENALFPTDNQEPKPSTLAPIVSDPRFIPIVEDWLSYKRERRESYKSKRGLSQFYNRLLSLSEGNPETARRLINTAMANNWAGIFPERPSTTATPSKARNRIEIPTGETGDFKSTL